MLGNVVVTLEWGVGVSLMVKRHSGELGISRLLSTKRLTMRPRSLWAVAWEDH